MNTQGRVYNFQHDCVCLEIVKLSLFHIVILLGHQTFWGGVSNLMKA